MAARCARRHLEAEAGSSSQVAELEEMVSALQQEKRELKAPLASVRIRAETSIKQLDEARVKATAAEEAAKIAEEGQKKSRRVGEGLQEGYC